MTTWSTPQHGSMTWACLSVIGPEDPDELSGWDNVSYAMKQAPAVLLRYGFPTTKVAQVVEAIRTHQPHLSPASLEGTILRDADILEQLGAIGILRVVAKIGRDTRYPTFTDAVATLRKSLADLPGNASPGDGENAGSAEDRSARSFSSGAGQGSPWRSLLRGMVTDDVPSLLAVGWSVRD